MKKLLFLLSFLFLAAPARSQVHPEGSLTFLVGVPVGQFEAAGGDVGFGVNMTGGLAFDELPVFVGLDLGLLVNGYERRSEPFSLTIPDVFVDVVTSNNILLGHFLVRLQPPNGPVRPYVDGLFGLKYFFTETRIEDVDDYGESVFSSTNYDDTALSYGLGGGLQVKVYRGRLGGHGGRVAVQVNAGMRYLFGGHARYLRKGGIRRDRGRVELFIDESETDMILTQLGVTFSF